MRAELAAQARLVRELFAPFRRQALGPAWRTADALAVARGAYDGRDWARLVILADALEEAGCTDAGLLRHLRGPGPHALGCWAVDEVLGLS